MHEGAYISKALFVRIGALDSDLLETEFAFPTCQEFPEPGVGSTVLPALLMSLQGQEFCFPAI
jgi:hypothetical protein